MSRARDFADLASAYSGGALANRNMIVNGAFQVDQKSETSTQTGSGGKKFLDGWRQGCSNVDQLSVESSRTADAPSSFQGNYSCKIQVKTVESSLGASEDLTVYTNIEGFDCAKLQYGSSNAKKTTLSFWVKSSIAGTFACNMYMADGNMAIAQPYTISSADTWEYKTLIWAGNTSQAITIDNTPGLQIQWFISIGSNSTGGSNGDSWHTYTGNEDKWAFGHTTNTHVTTDESTFQLTGVQFEIGDVATNYEHLPYDAELAKCQRYYHRLQPTGAWTRFAVGQHRTTTDAETYYEHPVEMRAVPSVGTTGTASNYGIYHANTVTTCSAVPSVSDQASTKMSVLVIAASSGLTAGRAFSLLANNSSSTYLEFSSEL